MKKIVATMIMATVVANAGILTPDEKVGNASVYIGNATLGEYGDSTDAAAILIGGNYYYNSGVLFGSTFGLEYAENADELVDNKLMLGINANFKIGYSFGSVAKGFGVYGLVDLHYLMYSVEGVNHGSGEKEDEITNASGTGFGVGAEYIFENGLLINLSYSSTEMTSDDYKFDYERTLIGVGVTW